MTVLIEDSPRNLAKWARDAVHAGLATGMTINPWATPWITLQYRKRTALKTAELITAAGGQVWFDPLTHALQMSNVGDFRFYDEYSLWSGARGDLSTPILRSEHVRRIFGVQDELGAAHLAPTILLHHGESTTSQQALQLAEEAIRQDPNCWLSIAGTSPFWSGGPELDAHIGALAQLEPRGWFLTVVRPLWVLPVAAGADEVHGLCRTARALSEYVPVHVSHGDLASLPAVAAGAFSIGSGWDQRQRVCAMAAFVERDEPDPEGGGGGGWFERPTYPGLVGLLKRPEAELLHRRDAVFASGLGTLPAPGPEEAFQAHLAALGTLMNAVALRSYEDRFRALAQIYSFATSAWPRVRTLTSCDLDADDWISELHAGLRRYGVDEGWITS